MMSNNACAALGGRRLTGFVISPSLPRHFALRSQAHLSNLQNQYARPSCSRKDLRALPGSARNFWWSSSKTPAVPKTEMETTTQDATVADPVVPEDPPIEVATFVDSTPDVDPSAAASVSLDGTSAAAEAVTNAVATVTSAPPPPLTYGDFAALGLAGWSPIGLCQVGIETLQVFSGMPWFWTIVTASAVSRAILLPFVVMGLRNTAKMAPHQTEFQALRDETMAARANKDMLRMQRAALRQKLLYEKIGVSMWGMFLPPIVQLPVTLGMFFGVKRICDLPVEQLKYSGFDLIPDLTVVDPTWTLPLLATAAINVQLSLSMKDMTSANPNAGHMINLFRGLSILGLFFMAQFPSGVLVYLLTTSVFMSVQTLILRLPSVRKYLGIPSIPQHMHGKSYSMLESVKYARKMIQDKRIEAEKSAKDRSGR
ncbi:hypothetical protein EIP86_006021 [Pleurotus ostreatoroseus]|nr:hypothetical protein EIP86_006021 [Pleurotus ostreatoroseus]